MLRYKLLALLTVQFCLVQYGLSQLRSMSASTTRAIEAPPFSYFGEGQCDSDGNMYFHGGNTDSMSSQIFRLSKDGSSGKFFRPSGKFADSEYVGFNSFWVNPDGVVFVLSSNADEKYVLPFDKNGSMQTPIKLQIPADVQVREFAAFESGYFFVWGYRDERSLKKLRGKSYQAILTETGELSREVSIVLPKVDLAHLGTPSDGAVATFGGNLYFLSSDQVLVISQTGEIIRRMEFRKPDVKAVGAKLYISGGMAVIAFDVISGDGRVSRAFVALDGNTGEVIGHYKPDPRLDASDVCFTRSEGMVFL
jgi:hypothetical protein